MVARLESVNGCGQGAIAIGCSTGEIRFDRMVTNLLTASDRPVTLLSNSSTNLSRADADVSPVSQPQVVAIPYLLTISNSAPTVLSSNASGFSVMQTRTITPGPLFWP